MFQSTFRVQLCRSAQEQQVAGPNQNTAMMNQEQQVADFFYYPDTGLIGVLEMKDQVLNI